MRARGQAENSARREPGTERDRISASLLRPAELARPVSRDGMLSLQRSAGNGRATRAVQRAVSEDEVQQLKDRLDGRSYAGTAFAQGRLFFDRYAGRNREFVTLSVSSTDSETGVYYRGMSEEEFTRFAATGRFEEQDKGYQGLSPTRAYAEKYVGTPGYLVRFELGSGLSSAGVSIEDDIFTYTGVEQKAESGVMSYGLAKTATLAQWVHREANSKKWEWAKPGDAVKYFNAWLDTKMITWRLVKCNVRV